MVDDDTLLPKLLKTNPQTLWVTRDGKVKHESIPTANKHKTARFSHFDQHQVEQLEAIIVGEVVITVVMLRELPRIPVY